MNTHKETRKPKGLSVEGFWRQLKDRSANTDNGMSYAEPHDLSDPISQTHMKPQNAPKRTDDDWLIRFDKWLDRL